MRDSVPPYFDLTPLTPSFSCPCQPAYFLLSSSTPREARRAAGAHRRSEKRLYLWAIDATDPLRQPRSAGFSSPSNRTATRSEVSAVSENSSSSPVNSSVPWRRSGSAAPASKGTPSASRTSRCVPVWFGSDHLKCVDGLPFALSTRHAFGHSSHLAMCPRAELEQSLRPWRDPRMSSSAPRGPSSTAWRSFQSNSPSPGNESASSTRVRPSPSRTHQAGPRGLLSRPAASRNTA